MSREIDFLIVGAGITGAVIARELHDAGYRVHVVEQRAHVGGNMHDEVHPSGIRYHVYGPHYFRTNSAALWNYVGRFGSFYPYEAVLQTQVRGKNFHWPLNRQQMTQTFGDRGPEPKHLAATPANFEEAMLAQLSPEVYHTFIGPYTEKQWGMPASELSRDLAGRIELRESPDRRLKTSTYQGIPRGGYTHWFEAMLKDITVDVGVDFLACRDAYQWRRKLVYTGPIDRFFDCRHGRLSYRAQRRSHMFFPDVDKILPCGQVNLPQREDGPHIRAIEWRHMLEAGEFSGTGTLLTTETPYSPTDWTELEYPSPDPANRRLYAKYRDMAETMTDTLICGRLGEYRYLDMDQALARALKWAQQLIEQDRASQ